MSYVVVSDVESKLESELVTEFRSDEFGSFVDSDFSSSDVAWSDVFAECVADVLA